MDKFFAPKPTGVIAPSLTQKSNKGLSIIKLRTKLQAQKYVTDFKNLESAFPQMLNLPDCNQRWQYLVGIMGPQGTKDPEMWSFINRFRSCEGQPKRQVRDRVITTAYVTFLALMHQTDATTIGNFKFHDSGIGVGAENVTDTALGTPWGGDRDEGTQVASTNTYSSVATTTYNATKSITEHGLFNAASGVTLMDRTKFDVISVVDTNQIQFSFGLTLTAGG